MPTNEISYNGSMLDGRRKLTIEQKEEIKKKYESGSYSWLSLAKMYNVSKITIGCIVNPSTLEKIAARIKKNWKKYYTTKGHIESVRRYRAKKKMLGFVKKHRGVKITRAERNSDKANRQKITVTRFPK